MTYSPAPTPPGRIAVGADLLDVTRRNPLALTAGVGMVARALPNELLLDSVLADPPESFSLWRPGAIATDAQVGVWRNTARGQRVYVRKLLANLATAQTVADVANYYRLKITDSVGAVAVVPMTSLSRTFLLDQGYGAMLDRGREASTLSLSSAWSGFGIAHRFRVAQEVTLTGLSTLGFYGELYNGGGVAPYIADGGVVRGAILDAGGYELAGASVQLEDNVSDTTAFVTVTRRFPFDASGRLYPGRDYWLAFDCFDAPPILTGTAGALQRAQLSARRPTQDGTTVGATGLLDFATSRRTVSVEWDGTTTETQNAMNTAVRSLTWPDLIAGTPASMTGLTRRDLAADHTTTNPRIGWTWKALGSPSGLASLAGDLTFAIDTVGAPVAGAAGADLNLSALLTVA